MGWHVAPDGLRDVLLELNRTYAPARDRGHRERRRVPRHGRRRTAGCATTAGWTTWPATSPRPRTRSAAGVPLTGYYVWSLLDNYEWSLGYSRRSAWCVDFDSQRRTPKDSALVSAAHRRE